MQLEVGKRYVTRTGRITAPLSANPNQSLYPFEGEIGAEGAISSWTADGFFFSGEDWGDDDLVVEYVESAEPTEQPDVVEIVSIRGETGDSFGGAVESTVTQTFAPLTNLQRYDHAVESVTTQRGAVYGHPSVDFDRAARLKAVVAECPDPCIRHALEMICVKMARLIQTPDHLDSWIDIAGYARTGVMCIDGATTEH